DYARQQRFLGRDTHDYLAQLAAAAPQGGLDLWLLEGSDDLTAGRLFQLSLPEMATTLDVPVLLVGAYQDGSLGDTLLDAQDRLGHRLLGVLLNAVPEGVLGEVQATLVPFLERQGIPVFGVLPQSRLLRCVSVRNLVQALQAEVVCGADRLDLLVEELSIGAMNVSAALEYLRRGVNMVVVTGSDRVDIQLAALETSTHCLVLTGHAQPTTLILERAQELEVPILAVDMDTLAAVAAIEETFAQVRLREPLKVAGVQDLFGEHVDSQRLLSSLGLGRPVSVG
ncbi:MAG: phosphotransacetylase family protein, partial [Gloeomargaritaceae cyanobacterium C42_A2020_066]|nr:phosphotransacetylase family protein [Gloeomargaritaceae cyanobacterium C42_A2020_066]